MALIPAHLILRIRLAFQCNTPRGRPRVGNFHFDVAATSKVNLGLPSLGLPQRLSASSSRSAYASLGRLCKCLPSACRERGPTSRAPRFLQGGRPNGLSVCATHARKRR
jgi:hypothetical protein